MSRRIAPLAVVAALLVTAAPAHAAKPRPKPPICNLITDPAGDAGILNDTGGETLRDPSLDIVSADLGVSATMLTAVIRLKELPKEDQKAPLGRTWSFAFTTNNVRVGMSAYTSQQAGDRFTNAAGGVVDWANKQIRFHVKLADEPKANLKKGALLKGFYLTSNAVVALDPTLGLGYAITPSGAADTVSSEKTFTVGAASCVKVGV
jgi:hypothetical protein